MSHIGPNGVGAGDGGSSSSSSQWEIFGRSNKISTTKKTDFSIESLLRVPYLCPHDKSLTSTTDNYWKDSEEKEPSRYFNFKNFSQSFPTLYKYNSGGGGGGNELQLEQKKKKEEKNCGESPFSAEEQQEKEEEVSVSNDAKEFSWLYCSRFKPPKLPRSKKRGGCKRYGRGPRIPFAPYQISVLENAFKKSQYLSPEGISRLAESLFLTETRIKIWLQNRRARFRREIGKMNHPHGDHCSAS